MGMGRAQANACATGFSLRKEVFKQVPGCLEMELRL